MIRGTVAVLIALLVSSAAQANYFTYQEWLAKPAIVRAAYIAGALDSLVNYTDPRIAMHYNNCIARAEMRSDQLADNVLNYARDKPSMQTGSVQHVLLDYLIAACGAPK
jgi:hypothetical protein